MAGIEIDQAIKLLKKGDAVAFPTETVYGLGADAWNPSAIRQVFGIKGRPSDNPLIVHISDMKMADDFAEEIPAVATKLMNKFWPGPLTIIFKKKPAVLDLVTGGLDTVALRCPNHHMALELISGAGPLVAPSANRSGRPSPTRLEHVLEDFGNDFPVVDGGRTTIGLESTVLDVTVSPMVIYRPGKISGEELERATDKRVIYDSGMSDGATRSPGTKYSHYAPAADVQWLDSKDLGKQEEALYLYHCSSPSRARNTINYSGDYSRMASELYDRFRQADRDGYKQILIQQFDAGIVEQNPFVRALYNRIAKAAQT